MLSDLLRGGAFRSFAWRRENGAALRLLARIGIEPSTIADVGASNGQWARLARDAFPAASLILFEPQPVHSDALDRFQAENARVTVVRSAVGEVEGPSLFEAGDPMGGVLQKARTARSITVSVVSLDGALATAAAPLLVKLDTHGVEAAILAGAQATLERSVAWIIEAYNQRFFDECLLFWELCAYMADRGFRPVDLIDVMRREHDGTLWQMDLVFVRSDWPGFRYLHYS